MKARRVGRFRLGYARAATVRTASGGGEIWPTGARLAHHDVGERTERQRLRACDWAPVLWTRRQHMSALRPEDGCQVVAGPAPFLS